MVYNTSGSTLFNKTPILKQSVRTKNSYIHFMPDTPRPLQGYIQEGGKYSMVCTVFPRLLYNHLNLNWKAKF